MPPPKLKFTESAPSALTQYELTLANDLSIRHGTIRVTKEAGGVHFYMASPECLARDGRIELTKMHLAVNVDKYLAGKDKVAMCMKTGTPYRVSDLLEMPPLSQRGFENVKANVVVADDTRSAFLEPDANGNMVPKSPGKVVPIYALGPDHPAQVYLDQRRFDRMRLFDQFRLSYCYKERGDVFYRRLLHGFKAGPQGRIIFYIDQNGINCGWQARILEWVDQDIKYYFQPYKNEWMAAEERTDPNATPKPTKPWKPLTGWDDWDPAKYVIGHGAKRNQCLLGYDAAVASQAKDRRGRRYCILCEGPLDAGRFGPPAMATMGKYVSEEQSKLLIGRFERVIYIPDNDAAGQEARGRVASRFAQIPEIDLDIADLPAQFKDAGEMEYRDANAFIEQRL